MIPTAYISTIASSLGIYTYCSVMLYELCKNSSVTVTQAIWSECCGSYHGDATIFTPTGVTVTP